MRRFGLHVPPEWSYEHALSHSITLLSNHCTLRTFKIIFPPTYYIFWHSTISQWYRHQLTSLHENLFVNCEKADIWPTDWVWVFLKYNAATYKMLDSSDYVRLLQPWLRRYSGECQGIVQGIRADPRGSRVVYGLSSKRKGGRYRLVERDECASLCGPKALAREEIDEDDWVNF
ncbi:uncharacterized protein K460DRAFT_121082 [Cucurbitaria berberidis CBS 394.84]|uniref:Uncharacterized protein n=1 Tax=Cucurbitaria berberidis CBS 394.84 TaxID=1168544 RepID=A0A9P4GJ56_9PLEO|nr:uncharacterized protein K460DRAFT_121082 [Cucurbitaria berberidis CBS 394.84]KAF1846174.1 hypothetical protein K460DRAFT_121082 [Cucurbitaria berberidis CBS 394.84]